MQRQRQRQSLQEKSLPVNITFLIKCCNNKYEYGITFDSRKDKEKDKDKDNHKDKDKMTKRPNMCHIFENAMTQGCQI